MKKIKSHTFKLFNARRRNRAKAYTEGKKKNIFGVMKNKEAVVKARKHLKNGKEAAKAALGRESLIGAMKKARTTRAAVKKKGAATKARNNVMKKMQMGQGIYV